MDPISINFIGISEAESIKSPEKSGGKQKSRIQILGINDPLKHYAIALSSSELQPSLKRSWLDRLRGIVPLKVKNEKDGKVGFIKVNAASLRKRFGITKQEFNAALTKGDLSSLISQKLHEKKQEELLNKAMESLAINPAQAMQDIYEAKQIDPQGVFKFFQKERSGVGSFFCGSCYANGVGVDKNPNEAFKWYQKAADEGNVEAMKSLGDCYQKGMGVNKNLKEGFEWYQKAVNNGHIVAMFELGICYEFGVGVDKNPNDAVNWYQKGAEKVNADTCGNADAMHRLGLCYRRGVGFKSDTEEALKWFRKGADNGSTDAMDSLAYCYQKGIGVNRNPEEAMKWYRQAADKGNANAMTNLGTLYLWEPASKEDNYKESFKWFQKGADYDNAQAMFQLGLSLLRGRGVLVNPQKALEWFRKAADNGNIEAMYFLSDIYEKAFHNQTEANKWNALAKKTQEEDQGAATARKPV